MAAMFDENFSFDSPRSPSVGSSAATRESSRSVSPFSGAAPFPLPRMSITDLATQFADQRIRKETPMCYDSCEAYANNDGDEAGWCIPPLDDSDSYTPLARSRTFPQQPHSPSRRTQRQLNSRLLCTSSHHRDIAALVTRMVNSSDQCSISPSGSMAPAHEDEGYSSDGDEPMTGPTASRRSSVATIKSRPEFRRSSDYKSGGTCVTKNVRFRKNEQNKRRESRQDRSR